MATRRLHHQLRAFGILFLACCSWVSSSSSINNITNSGESLDHEMPPLPSSLAVVQPQCDPCVNRTAYTIRAIVHGISTDTFWIQIREAALQSARDMRVNLQFDLYETYDAERMAKDILEAAGVSKFLRKTSDPPDALIVTVPGPVVEEAIRASSHKIPIFGMNSGYDRARGAGILGFVAMDEYLGGQEAAKEFLKDGRRITKALYINHAKGNSAMDARYNGFLDALILEQNRSLKMNNNNQTSSIINETLAYNDTSLVNVTVHELVIDPSDSSLTLVEQALVGCSYDVVLLGGGATSLSVTTQAYSTNGCTLSEIPLGTFDTNRAIFDALAVGKLSFAISQDQFLQGAIPVVLAAVYITTGFGIAKSSESAYGIYGSGPHLFNLRNLPSDTLQDCENEAFPVCQRDQRGATIATAIYELENENERSSSSSSKNSDNILMKHCPCTDRSSIRIGGVLHGVSTDSFWDIVFEQAQQAADDLGVHLELDRLDPQPTPEILHSKMANRIRSLCNSGVDGLFVTIPDPSIVDSIRYCQDELNIPVVSVNSGVKAAQELGLVHHISQLEYEAGKAAGEAMARQDITQAMCINTEAGNIGTIERCKGFEDAIVAAEANISYIGMIQIKDMDMGISIKRTIEEAANRNDGWDGLGILNLGVGTAGEVISLKEHHPNFVSGSFDLSSEIFEGIESGVFSFAIDQNPFMQGYLPVWLLTLLVSTNQSLKNTFIETGPVFIEQAPADNLDQCWSNLFEVCPQEEIHDKNQLNKIRPVGLTLCGIAMFGSVFFLGWCWYYRDNLVVIKSQPFFLRMICIGTLVMASSIIPMSIDDSITQDQPVLDDACMAVPWLFSIGFTTAFSALFSKIRRLNILMKSAEGFRRIVVRPIDVLPPFTILLTLTVVIMLVWTIVDPMYYYRTVPIAKGDGLSSMGTCKVGHGTVSQVMLSLLSVIFFLVVVLANVEAYKARKIRSDFSESKHVAMIMLGILQLILLGVPLVALVSSTNPAAFYFVLTAIIFVLCMSLLGGIFIPKIINVNVVDAAADRSATQRQEDIGASIFRASMTKSRKELASENANMMLVLESLREENHELKKRLTALNGEHETSSNPSLNPWDEDEEETPVSGTESSGAYRYDPKSAAQKPQKRLLDFTGSVNIDNARDSTISTKSGCTFDATNKAI